MPSKQQLFGERSEALAAKHLKKRGYKILEQNWRSGHREIDIIAEIDGELVVVEVKVRKRLGTERLEEHIPRSKQKHAMVNLWESWNSAWISLPLGAHGLVD